MKEFFAHKKAVEFYLEVKKLKFPYFLKDQIFCASSSIVLNLAEGYGKFSTKEKIKFYLLYQQYII